MEEKSYKLSETLINQMAQIIAQHPWAEVHVVMGQLQQEIAAQNALAALAAQQTDEKAE